MTGTFPSAVNTHLFYPPVNMDIGAMLNSFMADVASNGGGIVQIPYTDNNVFWTSVQIVVPSTVILQGAGKRVTTIRATNFSQGPGGAPNFPVNTPIVRMGRSTDADIYDCRLENIGIDTYYVTGAAGIYFQSAQEGCGLQSVGVWNSNFYGIHMDGTTVNAGGGANTNNGPFFDIEVIQGGGVPFTYGIYLNNTYFQETTCIDRVTVYGSNPPAWSSSTTYSSPTYQPGYVVSYSGHVFSIPNGGNTPSNINQTPVVGSTTTYWADRGLVTQAGIALNNGHVSLRGIHVEQSLDAIYLSGGAVAGEIATVNANEGVTQSVIHIASGVNRNGLSIKGIWNPYYSTCPTIKDDTIGQKFSQQYLNCYDSGIASSIGVATASVGPSPYNYVNTTPYNQQIVIVGALSTLTLTYPGGSAQTIPIISGWSPAPVIVPPGATLTMTYAATTPTYHVFPLT